MPCTGWLTGTEVVAARGGTLRALLSPHRRCPLGHAELAACHRTTKPRLVVRWPLGRWRWGGATSLVQFVGWLPATSAFGPLRGVFFPSLSFEEHTLQQTSCFNSKGVRKSNGNKCVRSKNHPALLQRLSDGTSRRGRAKIQWNVTVAGTIGSFNAQSESASLA